MKTINFIYDWGTDRKLAWSGTPYGIYSALQTVTDINDVSLVDNIIEKTVRLGVNAVNKISCMSDFNILNTKIGEAQIKRSKVIDGAPCITFLEYNSRYTKDTYVYQDLSVDYIARLGSDKSNLVSKHKIPPIVLKKRHDMVDKFYDACKGVFTMSEWLAQDFVENAGLPAGKVHCIGGGSNIDSKKYINFNKNGRRFLYVGKDWKRKNGPLVVQAFEALERKFPKIELYIAGPIEKPEYCSEHIFFLGRISYEQLVEYYNLCDYFVMPSRFEAYGIVFAEALIFGLPCIGKKCFAMPEFIQEDVNGYLLSEDSVEELSQLMERMIANRERLKEYCLRNHEEYISRYTWNKVAEKILDVMRRDGYSV